MFQQLRINRESLLALSIAQKLSIRLQSPRLKSLGKPIVESALLCMHNLMTFPLPLTDISKYYIIPQSLFCPFQGKNHEIYWRRMLSIGCLT